MKKLMIVAAAAMGLAAFGDIESINVVGYQHHALVNGNLNSVCHTFKAIDGRLWTLADLIPGDNFSASKLQFLSPTGSTKKFTLPNEDQVYGEFEYWREDEIEADCLPEGATATTGWYLWDAAGEKIYLMNNVQIPEGGMFLIDALDDDATIGGAGQVDPQGTVCALENGILNWYGNCTPADLTLADLIPGDNFSASKLQFLSPTGSTKKFTLPNEDQVYGEFEYWREDEIEADCLPEGATATTGWYLWDAAGEKIYLMNSVSIPAGAGFLIDALDDDADITVPSAL